MTQIILAAIGRITTHFREDIGRGFLHNGIDQGHGGGEPADLEIKAPADGVVTAHGSLGSYGKRLVIRHADGWTSLLAHHAWQGVKTGDTVRQGDAIAVMGNTGTVFVHSHQELRDQNGTQLDPLLHLTTSTAGNGSTPLEDDMPTPLDLLNASFATGRTKPDGTAEWTTLSEALNRVTWYGDKLHGLLESVPDAVWGKTFPHPLAKTADGSPAQVPAGDFLRYEPAEHDGTRKAIAAIVTQATSVDIDAAAVAAALKKSGFDPATFAVYAADEADRRERARLAQTK